MSDATTQYISPRQLARAAGVSESSVKRWCDQGLIPTVKTAGGHRRLTLEAAAEFLRTAGLEIHPEHLGLPERLAAAATDAADMREELYRALLAVDDAAAQRIVTELHWNGQSVASIADEVVGPVFERIGHEWECGAVEVYQERSACAVCLRSFDHLKTLLPPPAPHAPIAIGGSPEGDFYALPTSLAELVLQQSGWAARSLGSNLPFATIAAAVEDHHPQLVWLSVSHLVDERRFIAEYRAFYERVRGDVAVIVGGFALTAEIRQAIQFTAHGDTLLHLEAFAGTLRRAIESAAARSATSRAAASNVASGSKPGSATGASTGNSTGSSAGNRAASAATVTRASELASGRRKRN